MTEKITNILYPIIISRCQTIKNPFLRKDSQAMWKTVITVMERYRYRANWVTYILSKHKMNEDENDLQ